MGDTMIDSFLRQQLLDRRQRLHSAIAETREIASLVQLLKEVDSALERMENGSYGICEFCHEPVEKERLIADPLVRYCLDHLTPDQQRALEQDLELASHLQRELLPKQNLSYGGWQVYYHYEPLGPVSGDYCDVLVRESEGGNLFFVLADASGKGVTASMLTAHLHAIFRALIDTGLPLQKLVERASRIFRESTMSPYFATLVCGRARTSGEIEVCNAGHCPPLLLRGKKVTRLEATGLPLGLFCDGNYSTQTMALAPGDSLLLYTDGLSEARDGTDKEYGETRLAELTGVRQDLPPRELVEACLEDVAVFRSGTPMKDDLTVMAIRRIDY